MGVNIRTNHQPRELKCLFEFPAKQQQHIRSEFDWMEDIESTQGFFEYRGAIHHLENFLRVNAGTDDATQGWDGYEADTYFSGTLIRLCSDPSYVVVASFTHW
jgi:hypothetical protein